MIRNSDSIDETLKNKIANNPGITMSELRKCSNINPSTLRYRLMSLEFAGIIVAYRSRNATAYYVNVRNNPANDEEQKSEF